MQRAGGEVLTGADLVVPVPLHWTRLAQRRYNQAALLAHAIRAAGGPPVAADWLVRRRRHPRKGIWGRRRGSATCAAPLPCGRAATSPASAIVIIDDVMTTGATVDECARVLKRAGAEFVGVLTLARAVRTGRIIGRRR